MYKTKNERNEGFCSRRCRSTEHGDEISSAILRGNEDQAIAFMCWRCSNYCRVTDDAGRTALHIASSCGKTKVVEWILKNSDHETCINAKDSESGYTPLHRSLFHGQLSAARSLIKHGAKMNALDNDGLMPVDHLMKDRPSVTDSLSSAPCEVFVWGSNSNFNLGIGNHQIRRFPDTVDHFRKNNISIKKVAMGKFHSIFVSHDGRAFSCGHGQGGRLGLDSEETVMTPNQIHLSSHQTGSRLSDSKHVVVCASVGQDHSILLTEKGSVYTFGMNDHFQLGHLPPPTFQLSPKTLPNFLNQPIGVQAAHYHSIAWSLSKLFTWGLNGGQLGHAKVDRWQIAPKLVPHLRGVEIVAVAAGDGATVIASARGEVYVLQEYCCRRIGSSLGIISRIEVSGGRLDPALIKSEDVSGWGDYRSGEDDLKVLIVNDAKKMMVWQSSTGQFARCNLHIGSRNVSVVDAALGTNRLLVVTNEGEGFEAEFKVRKKSEDAHVLSSPLDQTVLQKLIEKDISLDFHLKRIIFVHRAVSVFCDPKGCNFSMVQLHPNFLTKKPEAGCIISLEGGLLSLLEEAKETDFISDVVFCIGGARIPAHRYILECNSKCLASLITSAEKAQNVYLLQDNNLEIDGNFNLKNHNIVTVKLEDVHPLIFKELLKFVYTGVCDFCMPGQWSCEKDVAYSSGLCSDKEMDQKNCETTCKGTTEDRSTSKASAVRVKTACTNKAESEYNPVNDARRAAVRFGLNDMVKLMDGLQYNRTKCMIYRKSSSFDSQDEKPIANISLSPYSCSHLYDVVIECNEGKLINAHKCILAMRSKYFETMFKGDWLECSGQRNLTLPFPCEVMETIVSYLYQNKVPALNKSDDLTYICHVLVAADQILLEGLKEICEISLANHVTLKNISEFYQMSDTYNAFTLKSFCMEYICHNLSALLESRALDSISNELFDDLQMYYWGMRPMVLDRYIALPSKYPDLEILQSICESVGIPSEEEHFKQIEHQCKSPPKKEVVEVSKRSKSKKKQRSKQSNGDGNVEHFGRLSLGSTPGSDVELNTERLEPSPFCSIEMNTSLPLDGSMQISCQNDSEKDLFQFSLEFKLEENPSTPASNHNSNDLELTSEAKINSVNEEEFPSLTGDVQQSSLSVPAKAPKQRRMTKLSQKARKKLLVSSGIPDESSSSPPDTCKPEMNAWKRMNSSSQEEISQCSIEVQPLSEIMNEERMRRPQAKKANFEESVSEENKFYTQFMSNTNIESTQNSLKTDMSKSNHWPTRSPLNECHVIGQKSFNEIIADELKQREITKKIMEKSLNLTQIEDRAIKDLQIAYNKEYEFDQRITVKRLSSAQASKPVWITSKSP